MSIRHLLFIGTVVRGRDTKVSKPWALPGDAQVTMGKPGTEVIVIVWWSRGEVCGYLLLILVRFHSGEAVRWLIPLDPAPLKSCGVCL